MEQGKARNDSTFRLPAAFNEKDATISFFSPDADAAMSTSAAPHRRPYLARRRFRHDAGRLCEKISGCRRKKLDRKLKTFLLLSDWPIYFSHINGCGKLLSLEHEDNRLC